LLYKEWFADPSNPLVEPPLGDVAKKAAYFAKVDESVNPDPRTPIEYVSGRSFASRRLLTLHQDH